jgi:penicillin-binding protein 2
MSRDWRNQFPSRRQMFLVGGSVAFVGLSARLAELQIFRAEEFDAKAKDNRIRLEPAPAHRGTIYDRTGRTLAGSKRNFYVTARPEMLGDKIKIDDILDELSKIIPLTEQKKRSIRQEALSRAVVNDILIADDLTWEEFAAVNVMAPQFEGSVSADVGELRSYPLQGAFYHIIGYVQKADEKAIIRITEKELLKAGESADSEAGKQRTTAIRRLYKNPQMRVGKQGLESFGEDELKGVPGRQRVLVNAAGRVIDHLASEDLTGTPGNDTVLALDAELQNYAIQRFGNESGCAVIIDVASGDVVCMMSTPAPDPNAFVSGIGSALYKSLQEDIRNPMYHKAYDGVYCPGSTFKIVVAAAALEAGAMTPEDKVHCSGRAWYYNRFYHCHKAEGHGWMNLQTGMANSCDCYFYEAARRVGIEKIAEMGKKFGMAHHYELGLTGGRVGQMPNDEWKRGRFKERWYDGDTISAGIGQGYVETSPFQLAVMCSRIAGGHSAPNPRLVVSGIQAPDQTIQPLGEISEKTLELVRSGMVAVATFGTAARYGALDPNNELPAPYTGARMAGKSGSAQVREIKAADRDSRGKTLVKQAEKPWIERDNALFVAYAPTDKPRYAAAILVEHGGSGSSVCAPIAHDLLAHCLKYDPGAKKPFAPQRQEVAAVEKART